MKMMRSSYVLEKSPPFPGMLEEASKFAGRFILVVCSVTVRLLSVFIIIILRRAVEVVGEGKKVTMKDINAVIKVGALIVVVFVLVF